MNKPKWEIQEKDVIAKPVSIPLLLERFRFEPRMNKFRNSKWMVIVDKKTDKVLCEPGSHGKHMQFSDSDEAIEAINNLILKKVVTL